VVTADLDRHFSVKPFQKIEHLVRREAAKMPIHQVRNVGLRNAQNIGDFALFQFFFCKDFKDMESDLRARQKLVRIFAAQVREDVSGTPFEINWFSSFRPHAPTPVLRRIVSKGVGSGVLEIALRCGSDAYRAVLGAAAWQAGCDFGWEQCLRA
jgi:hypothetical protein